MDTAIRDYQSFQLLKDSKVAVIDVGKIQVDMDWFNWKESFVGRTRAQASYLDP